MNLKDRNNSSTSRFGFRPQTSKQSAECHQNDGASVKNNSRSPGDHVPVRNAASKHTIRQSCAPAIEASNQIKKKKSGENQPSSDQCSAASNDSNSSLCTKSTSSNAKSVGAAVQHVLHCSRGHVLQTYDPTLARRSRSRDMGAEVRGRFESKERVKTRDQSLKPVKARARSRDQSLKSINRGAPQKSWDHGAPSKNSQSVHPPNTSSGKSSASKGHSESTSRRSYNVVGENCAARDSENNLIDVSLQSDLNFLRKKLLELRAVLSAGGNSSLGEGDTSTLKEENCVLREENVQLKEKIKLLESQLSIKLQQINEMNDKFITTMDVTASQHGHARTLHDLSTNSSKCPKSHSIQAEVNSNELTGFLIRDPNDNISRTVASPTEPASKFHDNSNQQTHQSTARNEIVAENLHTQQKIKKPSQLPTMLPLRKSFNPTSNLKTNPDKGATLDNRISHDRIAFGQHNTDNTKRVPKPTRVVK